MVLVADAVDDSGAGRAGGHLGCLGCPPFALRSTSKRPRRMSTTRPAAPATAAISIAALAEPAELLSAPVELTLGASSVVVLTASRVADAGGDGAAVNVGAGLAVGGGAASKGGGAGEA